MSQNAQFKFVFLIFPTYCISNACTAHGDCSAKTTNSKCYCDLIKAEEINQLFGKLNKTRRIELKTRRASLQTKISVITLDSGTRRRSFDLSLCANLIISTRTTNE